MQVGHDWSFSICQYVRLFCSVYMLCKCCEGVVCMVLVVVNTCQVNSVVRKSAIIGSVIVDITFYINFTF